MKKHLDNIGELLKNQRIAKDLTLEQVADGICSLSYLSLCESGKRFPSRKILRDLAFRLDLKLDQQGIATSNEGIAQALLGLRLGELDSVAKIVKTLESAAEKNLIKGLLAEAKGDMVNAIKLLEGVFTNQAAPNEFRMRAAIALCRVLAESGDTHYSLQIGESALTNLGEYEGFEPELFFELKATLSNSYVAAGDLNRAMSLVRDHSANLVTSKWQQVMSLWSQTSILENAGELNQARELSVKALQIANELDRPLARAALLNTSAWLQLKTGNANPVEIETSLNQAEAILREAQSETSLARCLDTRAMAESMFGNKARAEELIQEALSLLSSEQKGIRGVMLVNVAATYLRLGEEAKAKASLVEARELLSASGATRHEAQAWREMGGLFEELGDKDAALACLKAATDLLGLSTQLVRDPVE